MMNIFILISVHLVITNVPTRMFLLSMATKNHQVVKYHWIVKNHQMVHKLYPFVKLMKNHSSVYLVITDVLRRIFQRLTDSYWNLKVHSFLNHCCANLWILDEIWQKTVWNNVLQCTIRKSVWCFSMKGNKNKSEKYCGHYEGNRCIFMFLLQKLHSLLTKFTIKWGLTGSLWSKFSNFIQIYGSFMKYKPDSVKHIWYP